jgi:putative membrane protein
MTRTFGALFALTLAGSSVAALAQTPPPPPPPEAKMQAAAYVDAAGKSDMYEIESSKLALQKSQNPQIKAFANAMIRDHTKTTKATMAAAKKAGMNPPPPAPDAGVTASLTELQNASGADFDRLYLGQQMPAHQAALDLHRSYAANGDQPALKASAKAAVPIVQRHIDMAHKDAGKMGVM